MLGKKNWVVIFLLLIILLGSFLRFYKLGKTPFVADEFLDINSSYAYHKTGVWQNWDFNRGMVNVENAFTPRDERAWLYKWQVAQIFKFLPPTEAAARSISALWGVLTILLMFVVTRDFTKKQEIGLLSAFLFAISISGIIFDRRLRMYAMFFPLFLLFSWLSYKFLESDYAGKIAPVKFLREKLSLNALYIIPALLIGFVSLKIHQLTANIVMIVGVYLLIRGIMSWRNSHSFMNKYFVLIGAGVISLAGTWLVAPDLIAGSLGGLNFFENHWGYLSIAFNDYSHPIAAALILIAGIFYLAKTRRLDKEALWLSLSFFVPLLLAIFLWQRNVGEQYLFFAKSFLIILIASGLYAVADFLQRNIASKKINHFVLAMVLGIILLPNYAYFFATNNTYHQNSKSENPNYRDVFAYFKKNHQPNDVLVTRNFRNYYWSGAKVAAFDFGGELSQTNFKLSDLQKIMAENKSGWFIYASNDEDYIEKTAQKFAEENMQKINVIAVRGDVSVYRWGND